MNIEIGKSYTVSNARKKCIAEVEGFYNTDTDSCVSVETTYRSGELAVIPRNQDEVDMLLQYLDGDDVFELSMFEEGEMEGMFDCVCCDFTTDDAELVEQLENADDWYALLESLGYESGGCDSIIYDGIMITEGSFTYEV